jgi:hypothetical protein
MMTHTRAAGMLIATLLICGCATTNNTNPPANGSAAKAPCAENTGSHLPAGNCSSTGRNYTHTDLGHTGQ